MQGIDRDHSLLVGAIRADSVVGMAEALLDRSAPPRHAEIAVSVDTDLRGLGFGRFLVAQAIDRAALLRVCRTNLSFLRVNRPMQQFIRMLRGHVYMEDLAGMIPMPALAASPATRCASCGVGRRTCHFHSRSVDVDAHMGGHVLRLPPNRWPMDSEVRMTHRKDYFVQNDHCALEAGDLLHDMALRATVDDALIHGIEGCIDRPPHRIYPSVAPNLQRLVGLRIEVDLAASCAGVLAACTVHHLVELFGQLPTTATQTVHPLRRGRVDRAARPAQIDTCHALAAEGDVVAKYWPRFHRQTEGRGERWSSAVGSRRPAASGGSGS